MSQERPTDNSAERVAWTEPSAADVSSDAQAPARRDGKLSRSTIMMAVMFLVGAGWVIWESCHGSGFELTEQDQQNKATVSAGLVSIQRDAETDVKHRRKREKMFRGLGIAADRRQISPGELHGNPFLFNLPGKQKSAMANTAVHESAVPAVVQPPSVDGMELQSVITGPVATAIISGDIVMEGMTIGDWIVEKIQPREVTLKWCNRQHRLVMP